MAADQMVRGREGAHWLATLREDITFECLVDLAKLRWRIERDGQIAIHGANALAVAQRAADNVRKL
jgi:hypothetical protein